MADDARAIVGEVGLTVTVDMVAEKADDKKDKKKRKRKDGEEEDRNSEEGDELVSVTNEVDEDEDKDAEEDEEDDESELPEVDDYETLAEWRKDNRNYDKFIEKIRKSLQDTEYLRKCHDGEEYEEVNEEVEGRKQKNEQYKKVLKAIDDDYQHTIEQHREKVKTVVEELKLLRRKQCLIRGTNEMPNF